MRSEDSALRAVLPRRLHTLIALSVAAVAGLVLVGGWMLGIEPSKKWELQVGTMKPNTGLALLLCALSLWCRRSETPTRRRIAQASAAAAALIGAATLAQYIGGWNFGIDQLLFRDADLPDAADPGRMAIGTALACVVLGLALVWLDSRWAELLAGVGLALPAAALGGLLYGSDAMMTPFNSNAMPLATALAFIALGVGVLCARPRRGGMRLVTSAGPEGVLARRTLLRAVALIVAVGSLTQLGHLAGLWSASTRGALVLVGTLIGMVALLLWGAAVVERIDAERRRGEDELRRSQERLSQAVLTAGVGLAEFDHRARTLHWSPRLREIIGWGATEPASRAAYFKLVDPAQRAAVVDAVLAGEDPAGPGVYAVESRLLRRDGQVRWVSLRGHTKFSGEGVARQPLRTITAMADIAEAKAVEQALRASEQRLRLFLESAPAALAIFDRSMRYLAASRRWLHDYQLNQDPIGHSHYEVFPDLPEQWQAVYRRALAGEVFRSDGDLFERADGTSQWVKWEVLPWYEAPGEIGGIMIASEDVTERERMQDELRAANADLEGRVEHRTRQLNEKALQLARASRVKSEFLANMSHELRTPLSAVLVLSELLAENPDRNLNERQVKYARSIHGAGSDLLQMIDDILDLAKVEAGMVELDVAPVGLAGLGDEIAHLFRPQCESKRLAFELEIALDASTQQLIQTDSKRLRQILKNLVSNAIKFTESGRVRLEVTPAVGGWPPGHTVLDRAPRVVALAVQDSGIGIAPDQQTLIFDAFRQADGSTARHYGGTGLGLAISLELTHLLGGALTVQSTPGVGSRFTLWLPAAYDGPHEPSAAPTTAPDAARPPLAPLLAEALAPQRTGEPAAPAAGGASAVPAFVADDRDTLRPGDRVLLVVEDDAGFAAVVVDVARAEGFKAIATPSGVEAIALAPTLRPAAITLDLLLPDLSGWTVLERLHADTATRGIPVEVISILAEHERALASGATGSRGKPVTAVELASVCRALDAAAGPRSPGRLLIVEDDADQRDALAALIGGADIDITLAASGDEALQALDAGRYDCVVLDLRLAGMQGEEVLRRMRANPALRRVPVVVYTGAEIGSPDESRLRGLDRVVIVKGVRSPEQLLTATAGFLRRVSADLAPPQGRAIELIDGERGAQALAGKTVLLVDDDMRNLFALTSLLEQHGMVVIPAESGVEALAQLAAHPGIDLVLMDIMLPGMDGYQATRAIRDQARHAALPVIALTAKAMKGDREKCLAVGASDYLSKPIDPARLLRVLRAWLGR